MTFLNPIWLLALPLVLLPIVIHLLNQRRHRTVHWGAMQFLLSARRMSRGMARLKQMLIMAMRMLVIAGLIIAICRPLSSGWISSLTGGRPETVIVVLDRSASMQQQQLETGETKLSSGLKKIVDAVQTLGGAKRTVLIESCRNKPAAVAEAQALLDLLDTAPTESQADLPALLQTTLNHIADNQTGRTDIWICSDSARNDWNPDSSRWQSLASGFSQLAGLRFHVLNFAEPPTDNLSVVVDRVERVLTRKKSELVIDLTVKRTTEQTSSVNVPITFSINGLRSVLSLHIEGDSASLIGHRIPIEAELQTGWGVVELPTDAIASDNAWYFAFAEPATRRTVIVSDDPAAMRAIELAAATTIQNGITFQATQIRPNRVEEIDWQQTALVVWQAPLPTDTVVRQLASFVESGRSVLFLPPASPDETVFSGMSWGPWQRSDGPGLPVGFWNSDEDLLARTRDGQALPVNDLLVYRHCQLHGQIRTLAKLENGAPLLARKTSNAGAIYFLTTLPIATHSSLDREGITLFAMLHRAIATGAESLGAARQFDAGSLPAQSVAAMPRLAPDSAITLLAQSRPHRAGIYGDEVQLIALNRPRAEDDSSPMSRAEIDSLFQGLDYHVIDDTVENRQSLASEIWKLFLIVMGVALLAEAVLCLPEKPVPSAVELPLRAAA